MGSSRTSANDKAPSSFPMISKNNDDATSVGPDRHSAESAILSKGNGDGGENNDDSMSTGPDRHAAENASLSKGNGDRGDFASFPNMPLRPSPVVPIVEHRYSVNQPYGRGIPKIHETPLADSMMTNSLQNPFVDLNSNTINTNLVDVPLLPEGNRRVIQKCNNEDYGATADSATFTSTGLSDFQNSRCDRNLTIARNLSGGSQMIRHHGEESVNDNRPQIIRDCVSSPLLFHSEDTGLLNTGNDFSFESSQYGQQGSVDGSFLSLGTIGTEEVISGPQPNSREIADKLKGAASPWLDTRHVPQPMYRNVDARFTDYQRNANVLSSPLCVMDRRISPHSDFGLLHAPSGGPGSSSYRILQSPQNDMQHNISIHGDGNLSTVNRNVRHGDLDHYKTSEGDSNSSTAGDRNVGYRDLHPYRASGSYRNPALSGKLGSSYASLQHDFSRLAPISYNPLPIPSYTASEPLQNVHFRTADTQAPGRSMASPSLRLDSSSTWQNYAGQQLFSHHEAATPVAGGNLFPHMTRFQGAGNSNAQAATDSPFPRRLGVEFNGRGKVFQPPDKGSARLPYHLLRPPIDQTEGRMPIHHQLNPQGPFSTTGHFQDAVQLYKDSHGAGSINAPTIDGISQRYDSYSRPSLKRIAVAPPPAFVRAQRQKITQSIVHPSIPMPSQIKNPIPVTNAPATTPDHIRWPGPETDRTPELVGHKCFLCKRDLSFTSEGSVFQPMSPPDVAVLPCGHTFHDQCLKNITPEDNAKDPPCIPCAICDS